MLDKIFANIRIKKVPSEPEVISFHLELFSCDLKKDKILLNADVIESESNDIPIIYYPIGTTSGSNPIISPVDLIFI